MTKGVTVSDYRKAAEPHHTDQRLLPDAVPEPEGVPPTMPVEARTGENATPTDVEGAAQHRPDGEPLAGGVPPGTAPEVPAAPGTVEAGPAADDVYTPDHGPGGSGIDTAEPPLAMRPRAARQP